MEEVEIWKDCVGYGGKYQVSSLARVKTVARVIIKRDYQYQIKEKILSQFLDIGAYPRVKLTNTAYNGKGIAVHILVARAFIENPYSKPHVNHIDANRANPLPENLEWVTPAENAQHCIKLGRRPKELKFKQDETTINEIVDMLNKRITVVKIASEYNLNRKTIDRIKLRMTSLSAPSYLKTPNPCLTY
jgi:hypothetical protein